MQVSAMSKNCRKLEIWTSILIVCLVSSIESSKPNQDPENGCKVHTYDKITCTGNFNFSTFSETELKTKVLDKYNLEIVNTSLESINENTFRGNGNILFYDTILIQNATKLNYIHHDAFASSKHILSEFRAIDTALPRTFGEDEFALFTNLQQVYVGDESHCPEDDTIIFPCTCRFGDLGRTVLSGLYGTSWSSSDGVGKTTQIRCDSDLITGTALSEIFSKISKSTHTPKYFDSITIRSSNITSLPSHLFHNVTFGRVKLYEVQNLKQLHPAVFHGQVGIQVLEIEKANFTGASESETLSIFKALKSLKNVRKMRLSNCGIPFIPANTDNSTSCTKLRILSISFDRREHKSGVSYVGSYGFSWAPNLMKLGLAKNYINSFHSFSFGFHVPSENGLEVDISGNPFNDSVGLEPNAFSGSKRQISIKFDIDSFAASDPANDPALDYLPADVFRPFLEENVNNTYSVDYYNVDIYCDCRSAWMFEMTSGLLKSRVKAGLRITRIQGNYVESEYSSIQCKSQSSFECFPNCVIYPGYQLLHCGKFQDKFKIEEFIHGQESYNISKLFISAKNVTSLGYDSIGNVSFNEISLADCPQLEFIHPTTFISSQTTLESFSATNTNLKNYPDFANFRNLSSVRLASGFSINSSNFDYTGDKDHEVGRDLTISLGTGKIHPDSFTKLNPKQDVTLIITDQTKEYSTIGEIVRCTPPNLEFESEIFKPFLKMNPKNRIKSKCYIECSCKVKWMNDEWDAIKGQVEIWLAEYVGSMFYCIRPGANITANPDSFFGFNSKEFVQDKYFKEYC